MKDWEALGPIYGKMGIATSPEIIAARKTAAEAGYQAFKSPYLAGVLRGALGLGVDASVKPLFDAMREKDPTLDVEPADLEAGALLGAIISAEMGDKTALGGLAALGLVTASFGAMRQSLTHPGLVRQAEETLANMQVAVGGKPKDITAPTMPDEVKTALDGMTAANGPYGQTLAPAPAMTAIKKVAEFALTVQTSAATQVNASMAYTRRLEEELRTYWWVVGAWSDELKKPFRDMKSNEAAIFAGLELAAKTTLPLGLFAAPALLDRVIREDRKGRPPKTALSDAVSQVSRGFGQRVQPATALNADLLPLSLALQLSGEGAEDEDWRPRFKRITQLDANLKLGPIDLALQMYREAVIGRALPRPKS